ncbi:unnamed protein product, partial [Brassica oleracea var. botrytis]
LLQTRVINFVEKDISEMWPKWDSEVEDLPAENIIKVMYERRPWKWTMDCWEVTEAREEARGVTREELEIMFKGVADCMKKGFNKCMREFRKLSDRLEAVEKKVGVTNQATPPPLTNQATPQDKQPTPLAKETGATEANSVNKILPEDKADGVTSKEIVAVTSTDHQPSLASTDQQPSLASTEPSDPVSEPSLVVLDKRAKSKRAKKPAPTVRSPYTAEKKKDKVAAYNPFPPVNKDKLKELADWLKTDPHYLTKTKDKPRTSPTRWYHFLRTARGWLEDCHIDAWINVLRQRYQENPQAFRSERMCFLDHNFSQSWREQYQLFKTSEPDHKGLGRVLPVNLDDKHWVAIWISIPKRHIVVWDSIPSSSPYTYDRPLKGVPTANNGDCGVYAVKYIECHALGVSFDPKD